MKIFFLLFGFMITKGLEAQFSNPSFEDWEVIHLGQPYENPIGWTTNNLTDKNGFASTPVDKGINNNGFYARVSSTASGIDATLSGMLSQKIVLSDLVTIEFDSQCDSLFQAGRCVVSILNESGGTTLYVDTISTSSDEFSHMILSVDSDWALTNDSIILQFTAVGGFDKWDEKEDGYAAFLIDNVNATYITSAEVVNSEDVRFYPNPTAGIIHFEVPLYESPDHIQIVTLTGQLMQTIDFANTINIEMLPDGVYVLSLISRNKCYSELLLLNK